MTQASRVWIAAAVVGSLTFAGGELLRGQDQAALQNADPPQGAIWVDSLDLSKAPIRRPRAGGAGQRGGQRGADPNAPPPPPPPPLVYTVGGVAYPHGIGLNVNSDLAIDLKGAATKFVAMVGLEEVMPQAPGRGGAAPAAGTPAPPPPPPQGSVTFDVWVDGKHVGDSGVMRRGDAPKRMSIDVTGARRLILSVNDAGDGTAGDTSDFAGAALVLAPNAQAKPEFMTLPREDAPPIASSRTAVPMLNYPRITGATPGRPFQFMIPASGDEPMTFAAKNLPPGLTLDTKRGLITGSLKSDGQTVVTITVTNAKGKATGDVTIVGGKHKLALTPPLGWNSWNAWGNTVTADRVRASADGMIKSGLARQGYTYINIDDVWEAGNEPNPETGRGRNPSIARDKNGEIMSNTNFPDMKGLVDHIHSLGLKAGIYSSPGPTTCQGLAATLGHEEQDARTWAKWGFDYLKYDWCSYPGSRNELENNKKPYILMRSVLDTLDRDFVFSMCQYGDGKVWEWGAEVGGDLWRVTGDIRDSWASMSGIGFAQTGHEKFAGPGGWNDTDMLVVGQVGWSQGTRPTELTPNEQITHISLWTLQAAPLIIGADLSVIDEFTTNLLGNREVLGVNQDVLGKSATRIFSDGRTDIWARPLSDGTMAVGLFNRGPEPTTIAAKFSDLGLTGSQPVRDLWMQKDLSRVSNEFLATVPRHGAVLVKIGTPKK